MNKFYCPDCNELLEEQSGCGSVSYFCDHCKQLVSRSMMLTEEELADKVEKTEKTEE